MTHALMPGKTFYVAPMQVASQTGQLPPGSPMLTKQAGTANVPAQWNGIEYEAKPFKVE